MMQISSTPVASSSTPPAPLPGNGPPNTFNISTECPPPQPDLSLLVQKCTRCPYTGPITSFPPRRTGGGHLKVCPPCMERQNARKAASDIAAENSGRGEIATAAMSLDDFLAHVTLNKTRPFDFDTMVSVPQGFFSAGEHLYNRSNRIRDYLAEASDYHWNQKKTKRGGKSTVVTYFCAQLEGEQSKSRTQDADRKSRSRITRYHCGGWLRITIMDDNENLLRIRMTHAEAHPSFPASFRRPPHTSEFKLETTPKPGPGPGPGPPPPPGHGSIGVGVGSVPVPGPPPQHPHPHPAVAHSHPSRPHPHSQPQPPPSPLPPPPIFAGLQHPPPPTHVLVEPGPAGHSIPPPCHPPVHAPMPPHPPHPSHLDEANHTGIAIEGILAPDQLPPQASHSPHHVVFFSPEQLEGLKRKFEEMMTAASGPVPSDLAHALGSVFDHIERTATDVDITRFAKRRRISES